MDPAEIVHRAGGQATTAEILARCSRPALQRALDSGAVVRLRIGHYCLPRLPTARQVARRVDGVLSLGTAAMHHGMRTVVDPREVHVIVPRNHRRRPTTQDVQLHYADLGHDERGPVATSPLRTILDCAATLPFVEALAIAGSALDRRLVTVRELREAADARQGRGRARMRRVARFADARADNPSRPTASSPTAAASPSPATAPATASSPAPAGRCCASPGTT